MFRLKDFHRRVTNYRNCLRSPKIHKREHCQQNMMSSNKKQHLNEEDMQESDEDLSSDDGSDDNEEIAGVNEEIQVDFEGRNPIAGDFDGIKLLLKQLFLKAHLNHTELSNIVISQDNIGSVMKQSWDDDDMTDDEDEDQNVVFGVTTVINLTNHKESECVQQIKALILKRAEEKSTDATLKLLRDILTNDSRTTGFIINERYINIPPQISVPMLENLCKEIKRANEKKLPYNFQYYVMILKFHRKEAKKGKPAEDLYSNPEEELFLQESLASFEYSVKSEQDTALGGKWREDDETMFPFRKVIVIDGNKLPSIVEGVHGFITGV